MSSLLNFAFALLIALPSTAYAAEMEIGMQSYFRAVWGLAIVVALMLGIYYLLRKRFSPLHSTEDKKIKILEIQALMPKKSLYLVEVQGREILLGVSQEAITHIADFPASPDKDAPQTSFAEHLAHSSANSNQDEV